MHSTSISFFFFLMFVVGDAGNQGDFGPFSILFKELFRCEGVDSKEQILLDRQRITKVNRTTFVYRGRIIAHVPITNDLMAPVDIAHFGNGGWKENYLNVDMADVCTTFKKYVPKALDALMTRINITSCPIPAGEYELEDFPFTSYKLAKSDITSAKYGTYKMQWLLINPEKEVLGCQGLIVELIPDKKKKKG